MKYLNYYENFVSMNTTVLGLKDAWMGCLKKLYIRYTFKYLK